jgi:hypothetical protein
VAAAERGPVPAIEPACPEYIKLNSNSGRDKPMNIKALKNGR